MCPSTWLCYERTCTCRRALASVRMHATHARPQRCSTGQRNMPHARADILTCNSALKCAGACHGVRARYARPHWRVRLCVLRQRSHLCDLYRWPPAKLPALRKILLAGALRGAVYMSDDRQRHGHSHHGPSRTRCCVRDHADIAPRSHAHGQGPLDTRWNHARVCATTSCPRDEPGNSWCGQRRRHPL